MIMVTEGAVQGYACKLIVSHQTMFNKKTQTLITSAINCLHAPQGTIKEFFKLLKQRQYMRGSIYTFVTHTCSKIRITIYLKPETN